MMTVQHLMFRIKRRVISALLAFGGSLSVFAIAIAAGWISSWYMVEAGSGLTTRTVGPWSTWLSAARGDADPYTRAHFARSGSLPLSADIARTWLARVDQEGKRLHSSCEYAVEGRTNGAGWWSLAAFDERGALIQNPAERYSFTSETIARAADGAYTVSLARDARAGNWLPTGGAGRFVLQLTVIDATVAATDDIDPDVMMPSIRRVACR